MKAVFLFPGQGSQKVGMGKDFYENEKIAREIFEQAEDTLKLNLKKLCFEGPEDELKKTEITQPAILTVSYIAFKLFDESPEISAGHSLGEFTAYLGADTFSFESAVKLVNKRGKYMQEAVPEGVGGMVAIIGEDFEKISNAIKDISGVCEIANYNTHEQIVLSGEIPALKKAVEIIKPKKHVFLKVSAPFHSSLMKKAEEKFSKEIDKVEFKDPKNPIIRNIDAQIVKDKNSAKEGLKKQVSSGVMWYPSMKKLIDMEYRTFIEFGEGKVLIGMLRKIARQFDIELKLYNIFDMKSLESVKNEF